jgi:ankyrin repeat protein
MFTSSLVAQEVCITNLEKNVLQAINDFRKEKGLGTLKISKILMLTANKNAETMANQTYTDFKVSQFGNYTGRTQRVKMATSVTTYEEIRSTLLSPNSKNAKILGNTDEFAQYQWKTIGLSLRKSNDASVPTVICFYIGESEEEIINPQECSQEIYFSSNLKPQPEVIVLKPDDSNWKNIKIKVNKMVRCLLYGFTSEKVGKKISNSLFDRRADSIRHVRYKDYPDYETGTIILDPDNPEYEYYEIHYYPHPSPIVPQDFKFKITRKELKKSPKNIWYDIDYRKGNTLAELKDYLNQDPKNLYLKDEPYKYTVLHRAVEQNNLECVAYLLNEKNVSVNLPADFGVVPMSLCKSDEMFDLLMSKNPKMNIVDNASYTLLHYFAINNVMKGTKYMVEVQKINLNAADRQGGTALTHAVMGENYEIAEYLIKKGAKQTKGWGGYPIHFAIENLNIKMLTLLLDNGGKAHINLPDGNGFYPLHSALTSNNMEMIKLVVESGANLNQMTKHSDGKTYRVVDLYCKWWENTKPEVINYLKSKGVKIQNK